MLSIHEILDSRANNPVKGDPEVDSNVDGKFVVHRHNAFRAGLHYDLRLGKDGVLKSWATRKLPELLQDKAKKILLFQTPDHFPSWLNFKGNIYDGYGKGRVEVFDTGTFVTIKWDHTIVVEFSGKQLNGRYVIVPYKDEQYIMMKGSSK